MPFVVAFGEAIASAVTAAEATTLGETVVAGMDIRTIATAPGQIAEGVKELSTASALDADTAWTAAKTGYAGYSLVGSVKDLTDKATGHKKGSRDSEDDPMSSALSQLSSSEGPTSRQSVGSDTAPVGNQSSSPSKNSPEYSSKAEQDPDIGDVDYQHGSSGNMRV
jgi:hypothetical protein